MKKDIGKLARKLEVVGDSNRIKILCIIFESKKICVSEIAKKLKISVAVASHHLNVLAKEGILQPLREGKMVCYQVVDEGFAKDLNNLICKYR